MSLTPGQTVIMDGITYVTLQTEDGSIALQEVSDYQPVIDTNTNRLSTSLLEDEAKNSVFGESHLPVDLSIANLQLQNVSTATDTHTNQFILNQQTESIFQGLSTQNQVQLFSQGSNVVQTFSDQTVEDEQARSSTQDQIQQVLSMLKTNAPVPSDSNMLARVEFPEASTSGNKKQEILDFIQNLQSRGYALDQNTTDLLMSGEVSISDFPAIDDAGLNQSHEGSINDSNNSQHFSHQSIEDAHVQRSKESHVYPTSIVPENLQIRNNDNSTTGVNLHRASSIEERKQGISFFIQNLQSRGYVIEQDTIDLLMSGEANLSDFQFVDEAGLPQNFEPAINIEPLGCINQKDDKSYKSQVLVPLINVDEDEEFSFLRSHDSGETNNTDSSVIPKRQPVSNAYQQAYLKFVEAFKSDTSYDKVLDFESPDQAHPMREFVKCERDGLSSYFERTSSSRGRGRGGIKHIAHNSFQKRWNEEDDGDYVCRDPRWKGSEYSIRPTMSDVRAPVKRGVGRPRGSGRKRQEAVSDDDYDTDDFESDEDSDYSGGSLHKGKRRRPGRPDIKRVEHSFTSNRALVQSQGQRSHRGRGRPRKNVVQEQHPEHGEVLFASLGDLHGYEESSFVVSRNNWLQNGMFDIFQINKNGLLKVYNAFLDGNDILHRSENKFTMSTKDLRISYKAIDIEPIQDTNIVKVKMPEVRNIENLENDPFMSIFNVFIQVLCCQNLEKDFLNEIMSGNYEHLYSSVKQIDEIITQCLISIQSKIAWNPIFKETMDSLRFYRIYNMTGRSDAHYMCGEIDDPNSRANMIIKFFGPRYSYETLTEEGVKVTGSSEENEYFISSLSVEHILNYHALRHYKMTMYKELGYILANIQWMDKRKSNRDLIVDVLSDNIWMNYQRTMFKEMILKADVILEVA